MAARHIFYQDVALFEHQRVVDRYIDILAYTFETSRAKLNVVSALTRPSTGDR